VCEPETLVPCKARRTAQERREHLFFGGCTNAADWTELQESPEEKKNREKINAYNREQRKKHNRSEKNKEKYDTNEEYRERIKEKNRQQRKKHQEKRTETQRLRRRERRKILIEHLGGKCVGCGTTENLQFDHLDRTQKLFNIGKCLDYSFEKLLPEVEKCQLLCYDCHEIKSLINHDKDKLAEGYRVTKVDKIKDKIIVTLEPAISTIKR
jgi:hypothetical protein